jgi:uncharacterized protein YrrD
MLLMGQQLINKPVMSLRTGGPIGTVVEIIINPNNLKIEGWFVDDGSRKQRAVLLSQDIRDIIDQGFVVNDHDDLSDVNELVRLKSVLDLGFELIGKSVITKAKQRLGKVNDFAFDKDGFVIQKLYVNQSIVKSFSGGAAIVDRTQIIEINRRQIIVKEATVPGRTSIVNPASSGPAMSPAQP